jgi:small subunit ribosomal protein S1
MLQQAAASENGRTSTRLRPGQAVAGSVVQIGQDYVFVDVGTTTEGRIDRRELEDDKGELKVSVGDQIRASVVSADDVTGPRLSVAFGRGRMKLDEGALESARDARLPVEGVVGSVVKGGVEVRVLGARAFCPASQLGQEFIADLSTLEGQKLEFLVLEVKNGGRDVIVSRKALLQERQGQEAAHMIATLQVGNDYPAKVVSVQKYGAFVDLGGGVEGLIHISELAHGRIDRVEDVLNVGEEISVRLLALQPGEKQGSPPKLRLSLRALSDSPAAEPAPERGEVLAGTVSKVTSFGVFVDTVKGTGLVPSRELGTPRGSDARRAFPVGKEVSVVLVSKDASRGITFSMARVAAVEERRNFHEFSRAQQTQREEQTPLGTFGALLQRELKLPEPVRPPAIPLATTAAAAPGPAASAPAGSPPGVAAARERAGAAGAVAPAPATPAVRPAPARAPAPDRDHVVRSAAPRGPMPADRGRVDRSAPAAPSSQPGKVNDRGVVRGRRRPGGEP